MAANAANLKVMVFFPLRRRRFPICRGLNPLKRHLKSREQQEMKTMTDQSDVTRKKIKTNKNTLDVSFRCFFLFYLVLFCFFKTRPAVIARYAVYVCDATRISVRSALPLATEGTQE